MAMNRYQVESNFTIAISEAARMAAYNRRPAFAFQEPVSGLWEYTDCKPPFGFYLTIGIRGTVDPPVPAAEGDKEPPPETDDNGPWDGS